MTMKSIPLLAAAMLAAPSANAALTLIATDAVTDFANYTLTGSWPSPATTTTGGVDGGAYVRTSQNSTAAMNSSAYFTAGFGDAVLVQAGTYQITAYAGDVNASRDTWHTFVVKLMTTSGVAWESLVSDAITPTVILAYANPNPAATIPTWVAATYEYVVPEGHALIGTEFTWGFTGTKPSSTQQFHGAFDQATVMFEATIPEPCAALLGGLGTLMLLRRRRA
jgi:hypothetical protein